MGVVDAVGAHHLTKVQVLECFCFLHADVDLYLQLEGSDDALFPRMTGRGMIRAHVIAMTTVCF